MKVINKRASFDFELTEHFEAGVILSGAEVKAVKLGHADLTGSFARIQGSEAYLINSRIFPYKYARPDGYQESRTRKLLLHKKQILSLKSKMDGANLTLVPISLYTTRGLIKLELGLGKPKRKFQKREAIKKKDLDREMEKDWK